MNPCTIQSDRHYYLHFTVEESEAHQLGNLHLGHSSSTSTKIRTQAFLTSWLQFFPLLLPPGSEILEIGQQNPSPQLAIFSPAPLLCPGQTGRSKNMGKFKGLLLILPPSFPWGPPLTEEPSPPPTPPPPTHKPAGPSPARVHLRT